MKSYLLAKKYILDRMDTKKEKFISVIFINTIFSFLYYAISQYDTNQFGIKLPLLESFYFSTTTMFTIGMGDITPIGKTAKVLVIIQTLLFWMSLIS